MTIYIDIIFLYNLLIDWILLWTVMYLLKLRSKWYRLVIGASIGALYTLFLFLPPFSWLFTFLAKLCLSSIIILATFGYHSLRAFGTRLLLFYLVSFIIGGGLFGVHYLLQSHNEVLSGIVVTRSGGFGTSITWGFILIVFPIILFFSGKGLNVFKRTQKKVSLLGQMEICIQSNTISCTGLIDTGNSLYDPISRMPVVIIEVQLIKSVLPEKLFDAVQEQKNLSSDFSYMQVEEEWLQKIRVIPYRSVSRGMDLLLAIKPEYIKITLPEGIFQEDRVLIGLNALALSSDGSYQAIIHPAIIQEGKQLMYRGEGTEIKAM